MKLDYKTKITTDREFYPSLDINTSLESDRGRIISSAAFRRLQNRTQVWSLELNSAVRSRLTHSLEVSQTARYIAKSILKEIDIDGLDDAFISIVEIASLLHDIGNPPFGHFAEMMFDKWMGENLEDIFSSVISQAQVKEKKFIYMLIDDLSNFDGNAQAMRIISKLQRYNLSYTQSAAVLKYTRASFEPKPKKDDALSYLRKKSGYYYSEREFVQRITKTLGIKKGHRFPLTYIMEAADDISYLTADLEDAVDKGIFDLDEIYRLILKEDARVNADNENEYFKVLVEKSYERAKKDDKPYQFNLFLTLLRAKLIGDLVAYVSGVYVQNHKAIFEGSFNSALLEVDKESKYLLASEVLRNIAVTHIYNHPKVEKLDLQAYQILYGLLNLYKEILLISVEDINSVIEGKKIANKIAMMLFKKLSNKHIVAYNEAVRDIDKHYSKVKQESLEIYYRVRLLLDYISGMTDDFALHEFQTLWALKI